MATVGLSLNPSSQVPASHTGQGATPQSALGPDAGSSPGLLGSWVLLTRPSVALSSGQAVLLARQAAKAFGPLCPEQFVGSGGAAAAGWGQKRKERGRAAPVRAAWATTNRKSGRAAGRQRAPEGIAGRMCSGPRAGRAVLPEPDPPGTFLPPFPAPCWGGPSCRGVRVAPPGGSWPRHPRLGTAGARRCALAGNGNG